MGTSTTSSVMFSDFVSSTKNLFGYVGGTTISLILTICISIFAFGIAWRFIAKLPARAFRAAKHK